jgi:NhaP-type Na+/H+ or K+/H+ antiporter
VEWTLATIALALLAFAAIAGRVDGTPITPAIVFAVMLEEGSDLPHEETILLTVYATVGLSVLLHGLTAAPLAGRYAAWFESGSHDRLSTDAVEALETV